MSKDYMLRIVDREIDSLLEQMGAVLIEGPKWCGKTSTGSEHSASMIKLQDPDNRSRYSLMIADRPSSVLEGEPPLLIDEWQMYPILWDSVRNIVDDRNLPGQFILTGSSSPLKKSDREQIKHSGIGRIGRVRMRPMTLFESGDSNGKVSIGDLMDGKSIPIVESPHSLDDLAYLICRGGWPAIVNMDRRDTLEIVRQYYQGLINSDVSDIDGVGRRPAVADKILRSISRNTSEPTKVTVIQRDLSDEGDGNGATLTTIRSYIDALEGLFIVDNLPAWSPDMRSKVRLRSSPKRNLCDPSLAAAALKCTPKALMDDLPTFGLLFESMCIRDLKVYAQGLGGDLYYYQDEVKHEVDAIMDLGDGRWGAIEIKLNPEREERAAEQLKRLVDKIDLEKMKEPRFLMIVTGVGIAHRRKDGVFVVPIGCLRD